MTHPRVHHTIHAVLENMLRTTKLDYMAELLKASDIDGFLSDAAWVVCSTYHTVLDSLNAMDGRDRPLKN